MSEIRICGVHEVATYIEKYDIKKLLSALSNYDIVDEAYGLRPSVISLNPVYWKNPNNWMMLDMDDTPDPKGFKAPTNAEVVKGIDFGAKAIKSGANLLVHCQLGMARSPAIAIGSMINAGYSIQDAYNKAKSVRSRIDPNVLIIKLIDEHLKLNGELIKYNNEHRSELRGELKSEYNKLMESNMHNKSTLNLIFDNIRALDQL